MPVGWKADGFPNEDKMDLHLGNLIKSRLGASTMLHLKPSFTDYQGKRILVVEAKPSKVPVYLKNGGDDEFFVRTGASSAKLPGAQMVEWIKKRFKPLPEARHGLC